MSEYNEYIEQLERMVVRISRDLAETRDQLSAARRELARYEWKMRMDSGDLPEDTREPDLDVPAQICF